MSSPTKKRKSSNLVKEEKNTSAYTNNDNRSTKSSSSTDRNLDCEQIYKEKIESANVQELKSLSTQLTQLQASVKQRLLDTTTELNDLIELVDSNHNKSFDSKIDLRVTTVKATFLIGPKQFKFSFSCDAR